MTTGPADSGLTDLEDRRAAVHAQLSTLSEHELRVLRTSQSASVAA